jgi:threonine dehydratase
LDRFDFSLSELEAAAATIYKHITPTPQINWPLLSERCCCEVWVKHENHLPTGAFKVRGGIWYVENLHKAQPGVDAVITATRGNHGQSVAYATRSKGIKALVVVPTGNNPDKNRAMKAFGAELIEYGRDFNEAKDYAEDLAEEKGLHMFPSIHPHLIQGVASYSLEMLRALQLLDTVYVPLGMGSGICGMIAARNALALDTQIVGVVAANAPTYALSFEKKMPVSTDTANTLADGLAVRVPNPEAFEYMLANIDRVVIVSEENILTAIQYYFDHTHNVAEGAGASPLAALMQEKDQQHGKKIGLILSGGNIDRSLFESALKYQ